MRNILTIMLMSIAISAYAAESRHESADSMMNMQHMKTEGPLKLKDGSYLFISDKGEMRMVDREGKPVKMKENVEMEMMDGSLIMMKNRKIWRHDHRKMK